jgi:hypothetical protein
MPGHLQKILYTAEAVVEGGREGHARALDGRGQPALPLCQRRGADGRRGGTRSDERLAMARRYLGPAAGGRYVADNLDPAGTWLQDASEHWLIQDQGKGHAG